MIYREGSPEPATGIDTVWDADGDPWYRSDREIKGWYVEGGNVYPWEHALRYGPLADRKDPPVTYTPQIDALTRALGATESQRGPLRARAVDLLDALAAQGWRLIHE